MKRDMDLIRKVLLLGECPTDASVIEGYDRATIAYHASLLKEAGYLDAIIGKDQHGIPNRCAIRGLTWQGHEFLDSMRDDTVWKKAKEHILKPGASWTVGVLAEWLKDEVKRRLLGDHAP